MFEVNTIVLYQVFWSGTAVKCSRLPKITQPTEADVSGLFSATARSQPNQTTQQKHPNVITEERNGKFGGFEFIT